MIVKRDRVAIMHDILDLIRSKNEVKPTQIMYRANLSHHMLTEYLGELLSLGFIIENKDKKERRTYTLTEKGYNFLTDYQVIKKFFDSYGLNG